MPKNMMAQMQKAMENARKLWNDPKRMKKLLEDPCFHWPRVNFLGIDEMIEHLPEPSKSAFRKEYDAMPKINWGISVPWQRKKTKKFCVPYGPAYITKAGAKELADDTKAKRLRGAFSDKIRAEWDKFWRWDDADIVNAQWRRRA